MRDDPATLAIFDALLSSVAEEMGVTLGRTAHSPNIKERRDYSCAVFDAGGRLAAQAAHIPVHLGAMPSAVKAVQVLAPFRQGDIVIFNDPYLGGTHLPDVSLISPVFSGRRILGWVASRAHHADIGGMSPGSMPVATELYQEGMIIPPVKLYEGGRLNSGVYDLLLRNVRGPEQRRGDFDAQIAANRTGEVRFRLLIERYGARELRTQMTSLMDYAERLMTAALLQIPEGVYEFEDCLDDDGESDEPVLIRVRVTARGGKLHCDFTGSSTERSGSINAVAAVTHSAVYYVARCLLDEDVPSNDGCFRPVTLTLPIASVVSATPPHAVSAGNVETSQRVTDVVLGALAKALPGLIPAASSGTMNNLTIGGYDPRSGKHYAYYETICGGAGAGPQGDGANAIHTHMTNTLNTPIEALEMAYPFRIREYAIRSGSGGQGLHNGGDGVVRTYEFLEPATITLVSDRRRFAPYGLDGGGAGAVGRSLLTRAGGEAKDLPGKFS
ncbi:MAG TPA: hydantoinase B/oxoprolinase family protein, partial [Dehalococcoidia bacterium]|nr:hydantoinase B/oxoprolinase family protein [Dehalococcoidia bacterium]